MTSPPWAITPEKINAAVRRIAETARPHRIILFGSAIRGDTNVNSDVDFLVVTGDDVKSPRKESVRIRRALAGVSMPIEILVVPETQFRRLHDSPGLIYREALREGRVVCESGSEG